MKHDGSVVSALRERREALDLSRPALGQMAGGISATTIWRLENGTVRPHRSTVAALAAALGVTVESIAPAKRSGGSPTKATAAENEEQPRHVATYSTA